MLACAAPFHASEVLGFLLSIPAWVLMARRSKWVKARDSMIDFQQPPQHAQESAAHLPRLVVGVTGHRPHKLHSPGMQGRLRSPQPTASLVS